MSGQGEGGADSTAVGDEQERVPTRTLNVDAGEDDTVMPSGPVPPPAAAPSGLMDGGSTKVDPQPLSPPEGANPFAGLLAEAQGKPGRRRSPWETMVVRERTNADAPGPKAHRSKSDDADTIEQSMPKRRRVGPYHMLEEIGSGGMAVVHKATQPALGRRVALKELRTEYLHDRQILTRFEREATSMATLQHGNIVHVYDFIREKNTAYIVMEYVDGIDLFDVLAETESLPADVAAICALQVCEGLEYAHYRGIVHRDIKPSNVLISRRGEVKIMDFGIARDPGKSELTQVGLAVGTPAYMAPEQIRGDKIDFRTDIFAVGIVLHEMLAGTKPWPEESGRSITVQVLDEPPVPLAKACPGAPPQLVSIVERCLQKDPAHRFQSTFELRRELQRYVQHALFMDPRGRLVLFLKNRSFVSPPDAQTFVDSEMLDDPVLARRDAGIPLPPPELLLKPVAAAHGIGLGIILATGLLTAFVSFGEALPVPGQMVAPRPAATAPAQDATPAALTKPLPTAPKGYLRVIVDPWAKVLVDGKYHDTTPFAAPMALSPGTHRISFRNPYCESADRIVEIKEGKTADLKVALIPRQVQERSGSR